MPDNSQPSFEDMRLQVGARLQLTLGSHGKNNWYSSLIGYVSGEYLLVKIPTENGLSVPLQEGERITVRAFSGVSVYTFSCTIESILLAPRYYMHLSFPMQIAATPLRQAARVKVKLPVEISNAPSAHEHPMKAILSDLSITGAFIAAHDELGGPGDRITIAFAFRVQPTNQEVRIRTEATIRSCQRLEPNGKANGRTSVMHGAGVHFDSISETEQFMLQHFLYEAENAMAH
jgi:c-di-GMP-binding flagellar brake protein YcgR